MKIKNLLIAFMALAAVMVGCNKDDAQEVNQSTKEGDLYLKFNFETSKAITGSEQGAKPYFTNGGLFFADNTGNIVRYLRIAEGGGGSVPVASLVTGTLIENVPNTAEQLIVIGNYNFDFTTKVYNTVAELRTETIGQEDQWHSSYGVRNASLYGDGQLEPVLSTDPLKTTYPSVEMKVTVEVRAILTRFEIAKLTNADATNVSDGFKLEGIYMNNIYHQLGVTGSTLNQPAVNYGQAWQKYLRKIALFPNGEYETRWFGNLFDDGGVDNITNPTVTNGLGTATGNSIVPVPGDANKIWAYNVLPGGNTPHIVLHLTNVKVLNTNTNQFELRENKTLDSAPGANTGDNDGVAYLTVRSYTRTGDITPTTIEGGHIYAISDLRFALDDLTDVPEEKNDEDFDVYVQIKLMDWEYIPVTGNF